MPDRKSVSPIGGRPNDFSGTGSHENEGGWVRRRNEGRTAKETAAIAAIMAAVSAVTGYLIAGAMVAVGANDGKRIESRGRRGSLDQTKASDKRLQRERIGGDPTDRSPPFAPRASGHDQALPCEIHNMSHRPCKVRVDSTSQRIEI
jgi:hypothetical protein